MHINLTDESILLLQGTNNDFFSRLGAFFKKKRHEVYKINFHAGDAWYYSQENAYNYRGTFENWPIYFNDFCKHFSVKTIFLFGDCRPYHRIILPIAKKLDIAIYVFEEGYMRPSRITLEKEGVNGFSNLSKSEAFYRQQPLVSIEDLQPIASVPHQWGNMAIHTYLYSWANMLTRQHYPNYTHHRPIHFFDQYYWLLSWTRKLLYHFKERALLKTIAEENDKNYYLVALQVYNDFQVQTHSHYPSIEEFISEVLTSFAQHAPEKNILVFKHHPMARGHRHYGKHIEQLAKKWGINSRIYYVHDLHLPTLLKHALGTVTINSTVGLSSLYHETPVKTLGNAFYNIPGLTFQGNLAEFWTDPSTVDHDLFIRYLNYLLQHTQIDGSFYAGEFPFGKVF